MPRARKYGLQELNVGDSMGDIRLLADRIHEQVDRSLQDPQTRILAASVTAGSYDWIQDPRTGSAVPIIKYHDRYYRISADGTAPSTCEARNYTCEVSRIWNFLVLNVRYVSDMDDADTYLDLRATLETGSGDCDDYTIAFCALLRSVGYQCAARIISMRGQSWDHVYPVINVPKVGWVPLDVTEPDKLPGWQYPTPAAIIDFDMGAGQ